jgi:hypothetical protein
MDASKVTQLRQQQANRFINRFQVKDASTLTWERQMQASRVLPTLNPVANLGGCQTCGSSSTTATITGSPYQQPNPMFNSKGSGSFVYTSDVVAYAAAGNNICCAAAVPPAQVQQYTILPACDCRDYDIFQMPDGTLTVPTGADTSGNWLNPYLPIPKPYTPTYWYNPALTTPAPIVPPHFCPACNLHKLQNNSGQWVYTTYVPPNLCRTGPGDANINCVETELTHPRPIDPTGLNY